MNIFRFHKRKPKLDIAELTDEELLTRLKFWLSQLKNISKIYFFCAIGSFFSPIAWFAFFYTSAYRRSENPLLKNWLKIPKTIIFAETIVQFCLVYSHIVLTQAGAEISGLGLGLSYFMFGTFFLVFTISLSKFHGFAIKRKQQYFINSVSGDDYKLKESFFQKSARLAKTRINDFKELVKETPK
jgi:hypothetical protein